jgi:hypothetical protein
VKCFLSVVRGFVLMYPCMRPTEKHYTRKLVFVLRPSNLEFDSMLGQLGQLFPGNNLASVLGISTLTLDGWRKCKNGPCAASRKLVWLLWALFLHPEQVRTVFDVATWGRFRVHRQRPGRRIVRKSFASITAHGWEI